MTDLAERLRDVAARHGLMYDDLETAEQAAATIERQAALLREAHEALIHCSAEDPECAMIAYDIIEKLEAKNWEPPLAKLENADGVDHNR